MRNSALRTILLAAALTGCIRTPSSESNASSTEASAHCPMPAGKYDLQNVTFHNGRGEYDVFVLGAPSCVKQPVALPKVKLARIDSPDKKSVARLEVPTGDDPTIHLTEDFKIEMVNAVVENGEVVREETSSWMPFLAGAAGAAVVGMAANAMFSRPQYYHPPPMRPGMAEVRGYGASAPTYQGATNSYQSKYNAAPPSEANKGFFRRKTDVATAPAARPQSDTAAKSSPKSKEAPRRKGFFRRRGR